MNDRPVVLTVEWQKKPGDLSGNESPSGCAVVTNIRHMNWLETLGHRLSRRLKRARPMDDVYAPPGTMSVGVEISTEQYARLLQGDPKSKAGLKYLRGERSCRLDLIPPPSADTNSKHELDPV
jgi:hypothetical protein